MTTLMNKNRSVKSSRRWIFRTGLSELLTHNPVHRSPFQTCLQLFFFPFSPLLCPCLLKNCGKIYITQNQAVLTVFQCRTRWSSAVGYHLSKELVSSCKTKTQCPHLPPPEPSNCGSALCLYKLDKSRSLTGVESQSLPFYGWLISLSKSSRFVMLQYMLECSSFLRLIFHYVQT